MKFLWTAVGLCSLVAAGGWTYTKTAPMADSQDGGDSELYIMNADGSNQTRLTNNKVPDTKPCLGPDGKLVFTSRREVNNQFREDVYLMTVP